MMKNAAGSVAVSRSDVYTVLRRLIFVFQIDFLLDFLIESQNDFLIDSQNGTVGTNRRFNGSKVTHKGTYPDIEHSEFVHFYIKKISAISENIKIYIYIYESMSTS